MTPTLLLGQMLNQDQGWLTRRLLVTFTSSAEWVLWLLAGLSVISIAVMLERAVFIAGRKLPGASDILVQLARGELDAVRTQVATRKGMEAAVLREGLAWSSKGPDSVEEVVNATLARERPEYERYLSVLGTLGANAPFIGLFGTVLGIIKAFHDLGQAGARGSEIQSTVMAGISEALVATAVGLAVAIPAVIAYNIFSRTVKNTSARATALGHALIGHLRSTEK